MANSVTRFVAKKTTSAAFCDTQTATAIWNALEFAHQHTSFAAILGEGGIGKTTTVRAYAEQNSGVQVIHASIRIRTVIQLVDALGRLTGIYERASESRVFEAIRRSGSFLIVDEAQFLSDGAIELLRYLNEPAAGKDKIGIALVGNPVVIAEREGKNRALYTQFLSRLRPRLILGAPLAEDYEALFDFHKIGGARSRDRIQRAAERFGALRAATFIIDRAREIAGDQTVGLSHIEEAITFLGYQ